MRYDSKAALLDDIRTTHDMLIARLREMPRAQFRAPGVWGDGWSVHDLVAHLAEWQRLFLRWFDDGARGVRPEMPAPGYTWRETPALNRAIQAKHASRPTASVMRDLETGYADILDRVASLSQTQLLEPGHFAWTGRNALRTYLGANTASHYRFAIAILRRPQRTTLA